MLEKEYRVSESRFISKTLLLMGIGLLITYGIGFSLTNMIQYIRPMHMYMAMAAELGVVIYLRSRVRKLSPAKATMWFFIYSALNGVTFSLIFAMYSLKTLGIVFVISSVMFISSAMIGFTTKKNLGAMGQFFLMVIIGLLLMSIVQIFIPLKGLNLTISVVGMLAFSGLTAYDIQKIKFFHSQSYNMDKNDVYRFIIISALELYLDFINLFLYVLRLANDD
ncbi:Bax inhibitor-1/YccA family protein [Hathewaya massiliensis]|uniref:Bax inhibitor-1/YccA family protein n=1 Tax=Hathewaya massiliensis TaxID=1964382 RepID=UPI001158A3E8|nr:Bax inhibitor-1/YccA family protein [Hathewaya massiliensis]